MDSKMNVNINLEKGTTNLVMEDKDKMFAFGNQNKQANEYIQASKAGVKFRPFETDNFQNMDDDDPMKQLERINSFQFKACNLKDEKSKKLYSELAPI